MSEFFSILTAKGLTKIAALAAGETIRLSQMVFGNSTSMPYEDQTELGGEKHRCDLMKVVVDSNAPNSLVAEAVIKSDVGGFWIREIGIIDSDGDLFAVGKYPATYKPLTTEGSVKELGVRMVLKITNADNAVVVFNNGIMDGAANTSLDNLTFAGQKKFDDKADKIETESELAKKATIESPDFTGTPTAPTPEANANDTKIATTEFVRAAITALINSSPEALDTLQELAAALGDDPNFATTITNALSKKVSTLGGQLMGDLIASMTSQLGLFCVRNIAAEPEDPNGTAISLPLGHILLIYED